MFFFIGGIQPKTKVIDTAPRLCSSCGQMSAYLKRIDHYLSLFFIPVFPVKKGAPFITCENCRRMAAEQQEPFETTFGRVGMRCKSCGKALEKNFSFCPYCGRPA
jgi:ribosomal protein S14